MEESGYICKECGMAVIVLDGNIIRACPHEGSTVVAKMSGTVTGESKLEQGNGIKKY